MAPVTGKILLDDRPLTTGSLATLPPAGRGARGFISSNGSFQLSTFDNNDGALVGPHKVAVVAYEQIGGGGPEAPAGKLLVPERYTNPESSGLTIEVPPEGLRDVELKLYTKEPKN